MMSWFLFAWAPLTGVITAIPAITLIKIPSSLIILGVLGPMAAILVGIGAGATSHIIEKKLQKNLEKKI